LAGINNYEKCQEREQNAAEFFSISMINTLAFPKQINLLPFQVSQRSEFCLRIPAADSAGEISGIN